MRRKSDGYYHQRNAKYCLFVLLPISVFLMVIVSRPLGLGLLFGALFGFFIDPDLDHEWKTRSEGRITDLFGPVVGKLYRLYWSPYEILFEHRSPWSHGGSGLGGMLFMVLVATPIRIIYAFWWLIPLAVKINWIGGQLSQIPFLGYFGIWLGWALQDLVHWIRDYL